MWQRTEEAQYGKRRRERKDWDNERVSGGEEEGVDGEKERITDNSKHCESQGKKMALPFSTEDFPAINKSVKEQVRTEISQPSYQQLSVLSPLTSLSYTFPPSQP